MIGSTRIGSQSKRSFFLPGIIPSTGSAAIIVPIDRNDPIVYKLLREKTYGGRKNVKSHLADRRGDERATGLSTD
jgi:hypothetical protein